MRGCSWQQGYYVQRGQDAYDDPVLHLRSEVRQQVDRYPRAPVPQEVALRERQTTETTATSRAEKATTATLIPVMQRCTTQPLR